MRSEVMHCDVKTAVYGSAHALTHAMKFSFHQRARHCFLFMAAGHLSHYRIVKLAADAPRYEVCTLPYIR